MKNTLQFILLIIFFLNGFTGRAQNHNLYSAICSGTPWFDERGQIVSAHAAGIIRDNGKFYLFGEKHIDNSNAFAGFNCYSSTDLCNWKFESIALPVQDTGGLGPDRIGERPKVMKCPKTGEYVMFMHSDDMSYKGQCVAYATSLNITGPYIYRGPVIFNGKPIRKWDMGTFQDSDGAGYIITHGGEIYKLNDDYSGVIELTADNNWPGSEAPAVFKKGGIYFWLTSHLSSWERNDNYYFTATSLKGPWTSRGIFAPAGTLTWNSQTTFVLPISGSKDTTFMFMGDRWSFPLQASSATYVWQPLLVAGTSVSMPAYHEAWKASGLIGTWSDVASATKTISNTDKSIIYKGKWQVDTFKKLSVKMSDVKDASFSVTFTGTQIGFYGLANHQGGYANVVLQNDTGKTILSTIIDMYSSYFEASLKFMSPVLTKGNYKLIVSVMGEHSKWSDKRKADYGSTGDFVALNKISIMTN